MSRDLKAGNADITTAQHARRVLIVDDEVGIRESIFWALVKTPGAEGRGYPKDYIDKAATLAEAQAKLQDNTYDVITVDGKFPRLKNSPAEQCGIELMRTIRAGTYPHNQNATLIFASADVTTSKDDAINAGANVYFEKPWDIEKMVAAIPHHARDEETALPSAILSAPQMIAPLEGITAMSGLYRLINAAESQALAQMDTARGQCVNAAAHLKEREPKLSAKITNDLSIDLGSLYHNLSKANKLLYENARSRSFSADKAQEVKTSLEAAHKILEALPQEATHIRQMIKESKKKEIATIEGHIQEDKGFEFHLTQSGMESVGMVDTPGFAQYEHEMLSEERARYLGPVEKFWQEAELLYNSAAPALIAVAETGKVVGESAIITRLKNYTADQIAAMDKVIGQSADGPQKTR